MEEHVSGIRDRFYRDLVLDYGKGESSLLYQFTWEESAVELLKKLKKEGLFPNIFTEAPQGETAEEKMEELRERLVTAMEGYTGEPFREQFRQALEKECGELQKERRKEQPTKRRDLWQRLWVNRAAFQAGIITEADYGLWLVEYLAAREKCYRESCPAMTDEPALLELLYRMVKEGLRDTENAPGYELLIKKGRFGKGNLKNFLITLAGQLENEGDSGKTVSRLGRLGILDRLWPLLECKAIHMKIKNWFQDSGFPLRDPTKSDSSNQQPVNPGKHTVPKGDRKQDFTMRLFAAYCDSEDGYDFARKDQGGTGSAKGWTIDTNGFCVMGVDGNRLATLVKALEKRAGEQNGWNPCYIPLAVHLYSGCVFFLAGSDAYEDLYRPPRREQFVAAKKKGKFCFDYLRLDKEALENSWFLGSNFRLAPSFHSHVAKDYGAVLNDFKRYCTTVALEAVREYNEDCGGAPAAFRWAFCKPEEDDVKPSPEAEAAIRKDREDWERTQRGRLQ